MVTELHVARHPIPCPICGYDLRATPAAQGKRRCPECGTTTDSTSQSHLPWVMGRRREFTAYFATLSHVHLKPRSFVAELGGPVIRRRALRFHRLSLLLAVLLATAAVALAFASREHRNPAIEPASYWIMPTFALTDSWWGLVPLSSAIYLAATFALAALRRLFAWGVTPGIARARALRLGLYLSAFAPVQALLLGLACLAFAFRFYNRPWDDTPDIRLVAAAGAFALLALALLLPVTVALLFRTGQRAMLRTGLFLLGLPAMLALTVLLIFVTFWIAGYIAIAAYSMTH